MSPGDVAPLALEEAGDLLAHLRLAAIVGEHVGEIDGVRRAIDALLERHGELAGAVLAGVEVGAEVPADRRIRVRHEDLGERALIEDGAEPLSILVPDEREHEPGAWVGAHVEAPALPG